MRPHYDFSNGVRGKYASRVGGKMTYEIEDVNLFAWESESDRRDFVRQKVLEACMHCMDQVIDRHSDPADRRLMELRIINAILKRHELEAQTKMYAREAREAEKQIDEHDGPKNT